MPRHVLHLLVPLVLAGNPVFGGDRPVHVCGPVSEQRAALSPPPVRADAQFNLTIEIREALTAQPVAARVGLWDASNVAIPPADPGASLYHWLWTDAYFYADGSVTVPVPPGEVTVKVGRGFEYKPHVRTVSITGDATILVDLERHVDMPALGWFSGDTHVHITHPPTDYVITAEQLAMVARAEDIHFVNSLEDESFFTGDVYAGSDPDHLIYFSKEHANADFSHLSILGLKEWINHPACGSETSHLCGRTLNEKISADVRAQDPHAVVIAAHPFPTFNLLDLLPWPGGGVWRGLPLDLAANAVDAMDILSYSHATPPEGIDDYYHVLNVGSRIVPSVGTDAVLCNGAARPPGGYRVYVAPPSGALTFEDWVDAFREGRSFVTNYPLITQFTIGSFQVGETAGRSALARRTKKDAASAFRVESSSPSSAPGRRSNERGRIKVRSALPIDRVEIVGNGIVLKTLEPDSPQEALDFDRTFRVDTRYVDWIVARVSGTVTDWHVIDANGLFAQTAPIFFDSPPETPRPQAYAERRRAAVAWLRKFVDDVEDAYDWYGLFPDSSRAAFDAAVAGARDYVWGLEPDPPYPFDLLEPALLPWGQRPIVDTVTPTLVWETAFEEDPGDAVTYRVQIDETPMFDSPFTFDGLTDTAYTIPYSAQLSYDVYYWRVEAIDQTGRIRVGTPGVNWFEVRNTATGAGERAPARGWSLGSPRPNPFSGFVEVPYTVDRSGQPFSIEIYDARGRRVATVYSGARQQGSYSAGWDGRGADGVPLPSGTYFVRMRAGEAVSTQKLVLVR